MRYIKHNLGKAIAGIALALLMVVQCVPATALAQQGEAGAEAAMLSTQSSKKAPVSKKALKWLKGTWGTAGLNVYGTNRNIVRFTSKYAKYYSYNGKRWRLTGREAITKVKKTRKGYDVYLANGVVYKGSSTKTLRYLDYFFKVSGVWHQSGTSSLGCFSH